MRAYAPPNHAPRYDEPRRERGPSQQPSQPASEPSRESGSPRVVFCVRLCDGRHFPIGAHDQASPAELCTALCPAAPTRLFYGREIDQAADRNGRDYAQLDNAFVYRQRVVPDCTCNGTSSFGVARLAIDEDPTLRAGDIVASRSGLMVYNGKPKDRQAAYTPIDRAKLPKSLREQLSDVKVSGGADWHEAIAIPLPPSRRPNTAEVGRGGVRISAQER